MYNTYGEDIAVDMPNNRKTALPSIGKITAAANKWPDSSGAGFDLDALLQKHSSRLHLGSQMFSRCAVLGCNKDNVQIHHVRKLARKLTIKEGGGTVTSILGKTGRRLKGFPALMSALNRKQLPLCPEHHHQFEKGTFSEIDTEYVQELLRTKIPDGDKLRSVFTTGSFTSQTPHSLTTSEESDHANTQTQKPVKQEK